jgi:quercetin dioxygenase-like cupin family protein
MTELRGLVRRPAAEPLRILLTSGESDGAVGAVELTMEPGTLGPPLHIHPAHAEAFYVLAGTLSFQLGEEIVTGGPGTWACAPKNVAHTLANHSTEPGRLLCVFAPAGFERRFERILASELGTELPEISAAEQATQLIGPPMTPPYQ